MFRESNKIIMIDDQEEHLHRLSSVFHNRGIGCKTLVYDPLYNNPLTGVRVLFMDINLNGATSESQRNSVLKDAIKLYIGEDNGPFILIFWTSNRGWKDSFIAYVNREPSAQESQEELKDELEAMLNYNPYFISVIDKTEFLDQSTNLEAKIDNIFNTPTVKALLDFESVMSDAVWEVLSEIINIIPKGTDWGGVETFDNNAKNVFAKIAISTLGFKIAKGDPDLAIKEAIIPVFQHKTVCERTNIWKNYLDNLANAGRAQEIIPPEEFNDGILNSIFHLNNNCTTGTERGAVCSVNIEDEDGNDLFLDKFGLEYNVWFNKVLNKYNREDRESSKLIAIEFSPACDYSQNKPRTNKYILGVITPYAVFKNKMTDENGNILKNNIGDNIYIIPHQFVFNGQNIILCLNLNYTFTLSKSLSKKMLSAPLFGFKKEIMDMVGNKYANHISRIGITAF